MADDIGHHRCAQALAQSDFAPNGCGPGLILDLVGQAKPVAFSVEGKAKADVLLQALFGALS